MTRRRSQTDQNCRLPHRPQVHSDASHGSVSPHEFTPVHDIIQGLHPSHLFFQRRRQLLLPLQSTNNIPYPHRHYVATAFIHSQHHNTWPRVWHSLSSPRSGTDQHFVDLGNHPHFHDSIDQNFQGAYSTLSEYENLPCTTCASWSPFGMAKHEPIKQTSARAYHIKETRNHNASQSLAKQFLSNFLPLSNQMAVDFLIDP